MAFPADLMRIMDQFGHCASPYRASFQIVLEIDICNFFLRRIWYELELSLITLRTNLSWFLSLFSLTQGESRNCRSRRRSNTSATQKQIFIPLKCCRLTSGVGVHGSTSMTGNDRDEPFRDSPAKIKESLLEGSKESLLQTKWTSIILGLPPKRLQLLKSISTQH